MKFNKNSFLVLVCFLVIFFCADHSSAQNVHSDKGNGTYTNPVISADFPDLDVILVGDTY